MSFFISLPAMGSSRVSCVGPSIQFRQKEELVSSTKLPWVARIALEELAEPEAGARGAGQGRPGSPRMPTRACKMWGCGEGE